MEIDITRLFQGEIDLFALSHSAAEGGPNAGPNTWENAKEQAGETAFLVTPEQFDAFRDHIKGFGAWKDAEIAAWSDIECNALFLQLAAGDIRSSPVDGCDLGDVAAWREHRELAEAGTISGRFYPNDDDNPTSVWYYLGD